MKNGYINWRRLLYHINLHLWKKIQICSDHRELTACPMVDDMDYPKLGRRMENIGHVHSHVEHKSVLGFKPLFLGIIDGTG